MKSILRWKHLAKVYYDKDGDLENLHGKTIAVIGYGHQGEAQALNLRDSGLNVIVGNPKDEFWDKAVKAGFKTYLIEDAAKKGDVLMMLIPDEVQVEVYKGQIQNHLKEGKALCFASGYNIFYDFIEYPKTVDVIMVAPKMPGAKVRSLFQQGKGGPAYIGVENDASGNAKQIALAIAKGIGSLRPGSFECDFETEVVTDLFVEHTLYGPNLFSIMTAFDTLVEAGYDPELVQIEFYGSGEFIQIEEDRVKYGLIGASQKFYSRTSSYGAFTRGPEFVNEKTKRWMKQKLKDIKSGKFAREWKREQMMGSPHYKKLAQKALLHSINRVEKRTRRYFGYE